MTDRKCNADLESLLRTNFGNSVKVVDHEFDSLVPLGENFGSDLRKLWIRIKKSEDSPTEDFHFVWKTISKAEFSVDWNWLLKREVFMYTDIVPLYSRLERGNEIPETIEKMVPKLYGHRSDESDPVILLENVRPSGYRTIGKNKGETILLVSPLRSRSLSSMNYRIEREAGDFGSEGAREVSRARNRRQNPEPRRFREDTSRRRETGVRQPRRGRAAS